jgi:hypothetical protein
MLQCFMADKVYLPVIIVGSLEVHMYASRLRPMVCRAANGAGRV